MAFMEGMNEAVSALGGGQPAACPPVSFEDFFNEEHMRLFRALYVLTGSSEEAEEIMQDSFVALWERWAQVGRMQNPTGYLYRTAMNRYRSMLRKAVRATRRAGRAAERRDDLAVVHERDALARALAGIPSRQRAAIVLTELLGYNSAETAQLLGVREATVRSLAFRARAALRSQLEIDDE